MKVLFLDRDWTINELLDKPYIYNPNDVKLLPFVKEVLTKLREKYKLMLITNQTWIGAWYYSYDDFVKVNKKIEDLLWFKFDAIYYCAHSPDEGCLCRKPNIWLFLQAKKDFKSIDWANSYMIGDKCKDVQAWKKVWLKTILLWDHCDADFKVSWWEEILHLLDSNNGKV